MERFERVEEFCQRTGFPLPESPEERLVLECFLQAYEHKSTRTLLKIFKYLFIFMAIVLIVPSNIMACIVGYPLIGVLYVLHVIVQLALVMMSEVAKSMKISPTTSLENGILSNDQFEWTVQVNKQVMYQNASHFGVCGGVLISPNHVLTAAHCVEHAAKVVNEENVVISFDNIKPFWFQLVMPYFTYFKVNKNIHQTGASKIYFPSGYVAGQLDYQTDIAIIRLSNTVDFVNPIALPNMMNTDQHIELCKRDFIFSGYGQGYHVDEIKLTDYGICLLNYGKYQDVNHGWYVEVIPSKREMYCTDHKLNRGDSGSPLMLEISKNKFMVAGIASYTKHIEDEYLSGVFVAVAGHMPWIRSVLEKDF